MYWGQDAAFLKGDGHKEAFQGLKGRFTSTVLKREHRQFTAGSTKKPAPLVFKLDCSK